ncbi:hypothetical protein MP478_02225 [Chryseobacterium sp. WG14]|uniref:hypothetical protein n=1 Tax=Chryseobacterium sp. WG14 TaxID=2926909 RepID=UPI00211DC9D2|nr:hypothetical protein [Chryseobacterium sp. WG14]MCQ9638190.1 hypothetical protein [Chryseobacterium sp. WG14]
MKIGALVILLLVPVIIFSQDLKTNKKIKSDTNFEHMHSGMIAPVTLDDLSRTALLTNAKNDSVFSVVYENKDNDLLFKFKMINGLLDEERLSNFYFKNIRDRRYAPREVTNKLVEIKEGLFRLNGISTYFSHLGKLTNVRIYEAGFWIFTSEMTQKGSDTSALDKRHEEVIKKLFLSKLVEKNPLSKFTDSFVAKAAFRDSLMLRSTLSSSFNKLKWTHDNIDKYERAAGLPGLYLEYQMAGLNGFIDYKTEKNQNPSKGVYETTNLIEFLTKLRSTGFMDEFLMESYYYLLIPPKDHKFDFEGYQKWKSENPIEYDVNQKYYVLVNTQKKADLSKEE